MLIVITIITIKYCTCRPAAPATRARAGRRPNKYKHDDDNNDYTSDNNSKHHNDNSNDNNNNSSSSITTTTTTTTTNSCSTASRTISRSSISSSAANSSALASFIWGFYYNSTNYNFRKTLDFLFEYLARGLTFDISFEIQYYV